MKLLYIFLFFVAILSCKSEQKKKEDLAQKILQANWPDDPKDETHFRIDTLSVMRVDRITDKELSTSIIETYNDEIREQISSKHSDSDMIKLYTQSNKLRVDTYNASQIDYYVKLLNRRDGYINKFKDKIDSIKAEKIDTVKKENYLVLVYLSHSSTYGRSSQHLWLYVDDKYEIIKSTNSKEY